MKEKNSQPNKKLELQLSEEELTNISGGELQEILSSAKCEDGNEIRPCIDSLQLSEEELTSISGGELQGIIPLPIFCQDGNEIRPCIDSI